jgi:DNA-binding NtrC family response regulator
MASSPFDTNASLSFPTLSENLWAIPLNKENADRLASPDLNAPLRVDRGDHDRVQPPSSLGCSKAMQEILATIQRVAKSDASVLMEGELGVGKEEIARWIHLQSPRAAGPFIHVVAGAIPESLLDERVFGKPEFARDNAAKSHQGLLAAARGGTLFLDDIHEMPIWAQIKLSKALREESALASMERGTPSATARIVAGSKPGMDADVAEGRFDPGLFYLLNVVKISIPPLRERRDDIRALASLYLESATTRNATGPRRFSDEAWNVLMAHDWPGNAIELAGLVERAAVMSDAEEIPAEYVTRLMSRTGHRYVGDTVSVPLGQGLREIERCVVRETIRRCGGNKAAAARALGLPRRTLYRLLDTKTKSRRRGAQAAVAEPTAEPVAS